MGVGIPATARPPSFASMQPRNFSLELGAGDMKSKRSWKWLVPRLVGRRVRNSVRAATTFRPCLRVEPLEDRLVMSATVGPPPVPVGEQAVVELLQGCLK